MNWPHIDAFAAALSEQLRRNENKDVTITCGDTVITCPGWRTCGSTWLLSRISDEVAELEKLFDDQGEFIGTPDQLLAECADIANFCMMLADRLGNLLGDTPEVDAKTAIRALASRVGLDVNFDPPITP